MKIPRPQEAARPFSRPRAPPTQATKLLLASVSAGLLLIAALAVVFIPRALQHEGKPPIPQIGLDVSIAQGTAFVTVSKATVVARLAEYNATLYREDGYTSATVGVLGTLTNGARNGALAFRDADNSGGLTVGDSFVVTTQPGGMYTLVVWYTALEVRVGFLQWTA